MWDDEQPSINSSSSGAVINTTSNYQHPPNQEWIIERHPDKRPSNNRMVVEEIGASRDIIWVLEVRGVGVVVMRADTIDGDVKHGLSIFTNEELQFDKETDDASQ